MDLSEKMDCRLALEHYLVEAKEDLPGNKEIIKNLIDYYEKETGEKYHDPFSGEVAALDQETINNWRIALDKHLEMFSEASIELEDPDLLERARKRAIPFFKRITGTVYY